MSDGFWAAYHEAELATRRSAVEGAAGMARQYRKAYKLPEDHVMRAEFPGWIFNTLTEDDRLELANVHHIHVVRRPFDE